MSFLADEFVGKERDGRTPVTVRFAVDERAAATVCTRVGSV